METLKNISMMSKELKSWSKTVSGPNGSKTLRVEQVENGYILSVDEDKKDEKGEWKYESKKYISATNPFETKDLPDMTDSLGDFLKNM